MKISQLDFNEVFKMKRKIQKLKKHIMDHSLMMLPYPALLLDITIRQIKIVSIKVSNNNKGSPFMSRPTDEIILTYSGFPRPLD